MKRFLPLLFLPAIASATWTVTTDGAPSGCTHVITDGNWQIGVYRYSDDNWNLCKSTGQNGHAYVAGEGDLDLRNVAAVKHATEWKASENLTAITEAEKKSAKAAADAFGLKRVSPIGKWTYQTGGYTHWVVEELPSEMMLLIK